MTRNNGLFNAFKAQYTSEGGFNTIETTGLRDVVAEIVGNEVTHAVSTLGYTRTRAIRLDRLDDLNHYFWRFPIFFSRAQLQAYSGDADQMDLGQRVFSDGVEYDPIENRDLVKKLVEAFSSCFEPLEVASGADGVNQLVVLRVEGYSSSAPFRRDDGTVLEQTLSDGLNLRAANERRRNVEAAIEEEIRHQGVQDRFDLVRVEDYRSIGEMVEARGFDDRPYGDDGNTEEFQLDLFTRSAHIIVMDHGNCGV